MRPLFLAFAAIALCFSAQTCSPNSSRAGGSSSGGEREFNTEKKVEKSPLQRKTDEVSPAQTPSCEVIESPPIKTKEEQAKADSLDTLTRRSLWATIIGVAGGLIGIVILIWQGILNRRAANAAKKSAEVAERTLRLLAAEVYVDAASLIPVGPITPQSYVGIKLRNSGSTRAEQVRSYIKMTISGLPDSEYSNKTFSIAKDADQLVRFVEFYKFMDLQTFEQIRRGAVPVKISGTVTYLDVFGELHTFELHEGILDPRTGVFNIGQLGN
jgi:hypothetical protein